ncbi:MAG: hypothetical protein H6631_14890 [Anaerolineaceae bacterium]|nr:hypothetical protein [Anaerolineaceae bacterium]MCB9099000.1 hypothetical protein [Anaerolineales bacterium]
MFYEVLKIMVLILGPLVTYLAVVSVLQAPELIVKLPAPARYLIEFVGGSFIVGAWLVPPAEALTGAMALIGLLLLLTPMTAHKLDRALTGFRETWQ